jgi:hypothetical protein
LWLTLTATIGFTKNLPQMQKKVLSCDGTFFLLHTLKPGSRGGIIQFDKS